MSHRGIICTHQTSTNLTIGEFELCAGVTPPVIDGFNTLELLEFGFTTSGLPSDSLDHTIPWYLCHSTTLGGAAVSLVPIEIGSKIFTRGGVGVASTASSQTRIIQGFQPNNTHFRHIFLPNKGITITSGYLSIFIQSQNATASLDVTAYSKVKVY